MNKTVYVAVRIDPVDGVQLSNAFGLLPNAQLFAQCYGGSVRAIQVMDDERLVYSAELGHPC